MMSVNIPLCRFVIIIYKTKTMETINQKKLLPTFTGSFSHGWDTMMKYFLILLLAVFVVSIIMAPMSLGDLNMGNDKFSWDDHGFDFLNPGVAVLGVLALVLGFFALAYVLLVVPVFKFGSDLMFVHAVRGIRPEFETLVKGFKKNYLYVVLANLLTKALIMLGFIFLFIPGIIIACRLAFVTYLVMDKDMDPIVAVEESWKLTKGHGWTIFSMAIISFFLGIVGLIMLVVGILPVIIWVKSSFASLYESVLQEKNLEIEVA